MDKTPSATGRPFGHKKKRLIVLPDESAFVGRPSCITRARLNGLAH